MKSIRVLGVFSILGLSGCQLAPSSHGLELPIVAVNEIYKTSQLTPSERCEIIRIDQRAACRQRLNKQTNEMAKAMTKNH